MQPQTAGSAPVHSYDNPPMLTPMLQMGGGHTRKGPEGILHPERINLLEAPALQRKQLIVPNHLERPWTCSFGLE